MILSGVMPLTIEVDFVCCDDGVNGLLIAHFGDKSS